MSEVNLEELRDNARTNYGITNAADLEADQLQSEMDAIDQQAKDAEKERKAQEKAEANQASSDATVDGGDATGEAVQKANVALKSADDSGDEGDEGDDTPAVSESMSRADLEARASEAGVEGDPADKEAYPNKGALVAAIQEAESSDNE